MTLEDQLLKQAGLAPSHLTENNKSYNLSKYFEREKEYLGRLLLYLIIHHYCFIEK